MPISSLPRSAPPSNPTPALRSLFSRHSTPKYSHTRRKKEVRSQLAVAAEPFSSSRLPQRLAATCQKPWPRQHVDPGFLAPTPLASPVPQLLADVPAAHRGLRALGRRLVAPRIESATGLESERARRLLSGSPTLVGKGKPTCRLLQGDPNPLLLGGKPKVGTGKPKENQEWE